MGKAQSRPGSSWSWSYKRRENPEGDSYILRGCINGRYRDSEEHLWTADGSGDPTAGFRNNHGTLCGSYAIDSKQAEGPIGLIGDMCSLNVALPPEVTGSRCSLKVQAMHDNSSSPDIGKNIGPSQQHHVTHSGTIGAVDCDVSLDAEKETQEWAFTLYDFDGHRRITREDLSSILKSISEALACSVILPPSGSRKLKLRLSVISDQDSEANGSSSKLNQPCIPSPDTRSQQQASSTQSTSLPSTASPPDHILPFHMHRQENKENALNRARDRSGLDETAPTFHTHRHSFNANHQCWRRDDRKSRRARNQGRSQSMGLADLTAPNGEQVSPERQHRKARKPSALLDNAKPAEGTTKKNTNTESTNCSPVDHPQENAERRSYYQELAGIDHLCATPGGEEAAEKQDIDLPLGASASSRSQHTHRHSKSSPHHRRSKSYEPQVHSESTSKKQPLPMNQELFAKYEYAQRHHKDYHMQLLEASRTRLEGLQPQFEVPTAKRMNSRHGKKRHSFPVPVQVVTTQVVAPSPSPHAPAGRGRQRRRSRRHHTLQPLTVMKHEIMEKTEGTVCSPVTHKHHHHHEHHHHHHYHHYHDID